jgi:cytoskeleton protein RodZ
LASENLGRSREAGASPYAGVGADLRRAREQKHLTLVEIARELRIRPHYLEAIEQGRFDLLPGRIYALGFLRSYGNRLGMDAEALLSAGRSEMAGIEAASELYFPTPLPEDRTPRAVFIAIGIAALIAIYALSAFFMTGDGVTPERVSAPSQTLPETLSGPGTGQPAASNATPQPQTPGVAAETSSGATVLSRGAGQETPREANLDSGATPIGVAPPQPTSTAAIPPGVQAGALPPAPEPVSAPPAPSPVPATAEVTFGGENRDGRIVIKAIAESWIEVRDAQGIAVFVRLLRPGESYRPPARPGLKLTTGNAGGLEIAVDGKTAPPLGMRGDVRRNVSLSPEQLLAGGV